VVDDRVFNALAVERAAASDLGFDHQQDFAGVAMAGSDVRLAGENLGRVETVAEPVAVALRGAAAGLAIAGLAARAVDFIGKSPGG
jgi:hypothetical protein